MKPKTLNSFWAVQIKKVHQKSFLTIELYLKLRELKWYITIRK